MRDAIPAPARRTGGHPAKRTFQAIRIAVNAELDVLAPAIDAGLAALQPGGRCAVLSYHSGEDRIVKARFRHAATGGWTGPGPPAAAQRRAPHRPPPQGRVVDPARRRGGRQPPRLERPPPGRREARPTQLRPPTSEEDAPP